MPMLAMLTVTISAPLISSDCTSDADGAASDSGAETAGKVWLAGHASLVSKAGLAEGGSFATEWAGNRL